jgi:hypothetical protein
VAFAWHVAQAPLADERAICISISAYWADCGLNGQNYETQLKNLAS